MSMLIRSRRLSVECRQTNNFNQYFWGGYARILRLVLAGIGAGMGFRVLTRLDPGFAKLLVVSRVLRNIDAGLGTNSEPLGLVPAKSIICVSTACSFNSVRLFDARGN